MTATRMNPAMACIFRPLNRTVNANSTQLSELGRTLLAARPQLTWTASHACRDSVVGECVKNHNHQQRSALRRWLVFVKTDAGNVQQKNQQNESNNREHHVTPRARSLSV